MAFNRCTSSHSGIELPPLQLLSTFTVPWNDLELEKHTQTLHPCLPNAIMAWPYMLKVIGGDSGWLDCVHWSCSVLLGRGWCGLQLLPLFLTHTDSLRLRRWSPMQGSRLSYWSAFFYSPVPVSHSAAAARERPKPLHQDNEFHLLQINGTRFVW